jgi:hypothetical protein
MDQFLHEKSFNMNLNVIHLMLRQKISWIFGRKNPQKRRAIFIIPRICVINMTYHSWSRSSYQRSVFRFCHWQVIPFLSSLFFGRKWLFAAHTYVVKSCASGVEITYVNCFKTCIYLSMYGCLLYFCVIIQLYMIYFVAQVIPDTTLRTLSVDSHVPLIYLHYYLYEYVFRCVPSAFICCPPYFLVLQDASGCLVCSHPNSRIIHF